MKLRMLSLIICISVTYTFAQVADKKEYLNNIIEELQKKWPNNKTQNIVFHGHSVPSGYYTSSIGVKTFDSYPFMTFKMIKEKFNFAVVNCIITAIGGENSQQGAARFEKEVLNHNPDILFIDYSLNDRRLSLQEAREAWVFMITSALNRGVKVILLTPTPDVKEDILDYHSPLADHAQQVRELADEYQIGLIDSYAKFKELAQEGIDINVYMSQYNHPNEEGHLIVAEEIFKWF